MLRSERIAVVSDVHGNLTALEAVLADLGQTAPDLIFHGGDLPQGGSRPIEIVDRIRDLGWPGVLGNTDEMLFRPEALTEFASRTPAMRPLLPPIEEMAAATRVALGEERLAWLRGLPLVQRHGPMALVHASPESCWRGPAPASERRRSGCDLWTAGPAGRGVCAYSPVLRSRAPATHRGKYRKREPLLRWRPACRLPVAGWVDAHHPARGIRRRQGTEGFNGMWPSAQRLGGENAAERHAPNALITKVHTVHSGGPSRLYGPRRWLNGALPCLAAMPDIRLWNRLRFVAADAGSRLI